MKEIITDFDLWKIQVPTGRVIGDCTCRYEALDVLIVCLKTNQGRKAWGFGETVSDGIFAKPAPWITPMPSLTDIRRTFEQDFWPVLEGRTPFSLKMQRPELFAGYSFTTSAVRIALWDLMAKVVDLPLYQFLGGIPKNNRVRAYASGLDFPLGEEEALAIFRKFVERGFTAVKVKVGSPDEERDLQRLRVVRQCVGDDVEIAVDANENWTCDQAIERIRLFEKQGIGLSYVEDPLPRTDLEGLIRLNATVDVDIVGHDYIVDTKILKRFAEHKAFNRLRVNADFDYAQACADIATELGLPLIFGNSMFELSIHAAVAMPQVDRLEFSDLAWNLVPQNPIRFENGYGFAPELPGHGLDPNLEMLQRFSRPEAAPPVG
jgi:L-alanine-DL-glutamate epimerase-like enolase superfamily enzyme